MSNIESNIKSTLSYQFKYTLQAFKKLYPIRFLNIVCSDKTQIQGGNSQWYCSNNHRNKDYSNIPSGSLLHSPIPMQQGCVNYSNVPGRKKKRHLMKTSMIAIKEKEIMKKELFKTGPYIFHGITSGVCTQNYLLRKCDLLVFAIRNTWDTKKV